MCSKCFSRFKSVNSHFDLCHSCNEKRLAEKGNRKKRTRIKYKPKETAELKVFAEIWKRRKHECEHCGIPIREARAENFSHRKPKSTHPELRLQESNISLLCGDCHDAYGNRGKQVFENRKDLNR